MATYTEDCIIVRKSDTPIGDRYKVIQFKTAGLAKGETELAILCGGNLGKVLAATVAEQAMKMTMIDKLISEV